MDQAEALRRKVQRLRAANTRVVAVLSGKGGVGKSIFSVNFALALNRIGKKTILVDLDIGMGNVDILLGLHAPGHFVDMLNRRLPIESLIVQHRSGLSVISGGSGLDDLFKIDEGDFQHFLEQFKKLQHAYDVILFDMGAGLDEAALRFISAVHEVILVTTPEPTALADAYAAIKLIHAKVGDVPVRCVINRYDNEREAKEAWKNLSYTAKRFLNKELKLLGELPRDHTVVRSVKARSPFVTDAPHSKIAIGVQRLAAGYLNENTEGHAASLDSFINKLKHFFLSKG
ncbi:MinD/ParA family protein [Caenibacillus caldisaponilyticus]|uniref:MinD/ParA family protein n=1 Tax=Caenibacillus caldisaponilyticus TaxID=1674942 RepID=UPI0009886C56|nr:MinD/ParA family protein [Caenibacillus caldisaponilyticus]